MQIPDGWQRLGTFTLGEFELVGELILDSERTSLRLFQESADGAPYPWWSADLIKRIVGTLHDGREVTLVDAYRRERNRRLVARRRSRFSRTT